MIIDFPDGHAVMTNDGEMQTSGELFIENRGDAFVGNILSRRKTIFLAGPTSRGGNFKESWRKDACFYLATNGFDGVVHAPENITSPFDEKNLPEQSMWKWERLDNADVIVFWVPREFPKNPGMTTNIEYGRYVTCRPKSCVYGRPEYANKMQYMDLFWKRFGDKDCPMQIHLSDTLDQALKKVGIEV